MRGFKGLSTVNAFEVLYVVYAAEVIVGSALTDIPACILLQW